MTEHPDIIIVCDHGIRGGRLDEVVRYTWPEKRDSDIAYWGVPVAGRSGLVNQEQLMGNRRGANSLSDLFAFGPPRLHHEIICVKRGCTRLRYRSDVARLQTLFDAIAADDDTLRTVFAVSASDTEIVVTLDSLHLARDTARRRYGLRV
jgi:hypothetical protein